MQVCDSGHDEIVYDNSAYRAECPACKLLKEMGEQDDKIEALEAEVEELKTEISKIEFANAIA